MTNRTRSLLSRTLLAGASALAIATPAFAEEAAKTSFDIPAQPLSSALLTYSRQADTPVIASMDLLKGKTAPAVRGDLPQQLALQMLLEGSGLRAIQGASGSLVVERADDPQSGSAVGDGADGTVEALIVTAQKKEEAIQDVPIAISAFTQKDLEEQKIEGGFDLLKAIPNVTFSKNNFSSYNFSIRGIGTKAVSATTDPGVSVSFNNTGLIQNRLFEQEYFDVERVEVLRGPQGTLYGRNATAGVINVISAKPDMDEFEGWIKGEVGNYHTKRLSAMINVPLANDKLAIRFAGAMTDRQGYDFNSVTKNPINGRDLWSARLTIGFNPTERIRSNLIWERFEEDDDRSRTGKQLCHRDDGPEEIDGVNIESSGRPAMALNRRALFSQGCKAGSLYDDTAFGTPNGLALPFVSGMLALGIDCGTDCWALYPLGIDAQGQGTTLLQNKDPYGGMMQSRDLRTIASFRDPKYRAKADVIQLNFDMDLTDELTLTSQTAYDKDSVYSFQDYNRFNTVPVFTDTSKLFADRVTDENGISVGGSGESPYADFAAGGVFCDPQLGCSDTLAGFDISQAESTQFSQELRLQSAFDGPINFNVGANYTHFKVLADYYVMYNVLSALAQMLPFYSLIPGVGIDPALCSGVGFFPGVGPIVPAGSHNAACPYIDPNPVESINGEGHNYFRSKNPYKLESWAGFGELYWQVRPDIKVTAGLRYTNDEKIFTPVPSQLLLSPNVFHGGYVSKGYPADPDIKQTWGEYTGRLGVDWKPVLSFTDETMFYAFYSRGYKGGGANPPQPGFATKKKLIDYGVLTQAEADLFEQFGLVPPVELTAIDYGPTFEPEFVNAFEVGAKNTLLGGAMTLNLGGFFYDYTDYQVSQIKDRTAVNENFDAQIWGLEAEALFAPSRNLRIVANLGYLDTEIADGETSIDLMDRTQGDPGYVITKPWFTQPSNCVVPAAVARNWLETFDSVTQYWTMCGGFDPTSPRVTDPETNLPYDPANYPKLNGGAGIRAQLGGNELPNSPHWTMNLGAQYGWDALEGWRVTMRGDAYWQSQSWARVYNADPYDKLHGWYNVNLSLWIERPEDDLKIELYVKNALDKTPITDAFLNSDDTALTTNVFVLDPRLIGLSIRKGF